jgi:transcription initiation factor TFIID subunit 2
MVDPQDPTKKITSFLSNVSIAPQHVGFAIGPFEHVDLTEFRESDEDDKLGQNAVPVHGFCLPGRVAETKNTCVPLAKVCRLFLDAEYD